MKHMKVVEVPAETKTVVDAVTCDICGAVIEDWKNGKGDEVQMWRNETTSYGDNGEGKKTSYDVCGRCFEAKIMPYMAIFGAKPCVEECDW